MEIELSTAGTFTTTVHHRAADGAEGVYRPTEDDVRRAIIGAQLQNFWVGQIPPSISSPHPTHLPFLPFIFLLPPFPLSRLRGKPVK